MLSPFRCLIVLLVPLAGCQKKDSEEATPTVQRVAPKTPKGKIRQAIRDILQHCEVMDTGSILECKKQTPSPKAVLEETLLAKMGHEAYALAACELSFDKDKMVAAVASTLLIHLSFAEPTRKAASKKVLGCLLDALPLARTEQLSQRIAHLAGYMAPVLGREKEVVAALNRHPLPVVRHWGIPVLWPHARMKAFPLFKRIVAESKDDELRKDVVRSFGNAEPNREEKRKICPWLITLMRDRSNSVSGHASQALVNYCSPRNDATLLKNTEWLLERDKVGIDLILALHYLGQKAKGQTRAHLLAVLERITAKGSLSDETRSFALARIFNIAPQHSRTVARKYANPPEPTALGNMAESILADSASAAGSMQKTK